eukprot:15438535-Alexandrium_andersonii.AAC.2
MEQLKTPEDDEGAESEEEDEESQDGSVGGPGPCCEVVRDSRGAGCDTTIMRYCDTSRSFCDSGR